MANLILASSSTYRAAVLASGGVEVTRRAPDFDESEHRRHLDDVNVEDYALSLATGKLDSVPLGADEIVIAADQVGVLSSSGTDVELTQQPDVDSAVRQLMAMSGSTHRLVNAIVVRRLSPVSAALETRHAIDVHHVTMRRFTLDDARRYVETFAPFDTAGSYRIEDDADLVEQIDGSGDDGVMGMPLGVLRSLLDGWWAGSKSRPPNR